MSSEVSSALLFEELRNVQGRLGSMEQAQGEASARLSALQTHLLAVEKDVANIDDALQALDARLARVERRLDIVGEPGE